MEDQIRNTYYQAFQDLLEEKIKSSSPDLDWLTRLYTEIKQRLQRLVRPESPLWREMEENLDPSLFHQMMEYKVYNSTDVSRLVTYVFDLCLRLGAPARDHTTKERRDSLLENNSQDMSSLVPRFILLANQTLDEIELDIEK